ncbi:2Fe-2S iron-sulfur cluster-binding protein [Desertivirga xinjiangensis]|uniref:2Fe-2S iron-sulfur cluster-binding protein n=1 Tax=Desertivirga xinjiangensis TaxID=539206 RepID=UPI002108949B|nr:2Fe-2S iron-sulfur cluster-binding protein [Pedobacter xinjiangensis]
MIRIRVEDRDGSIRVIEIPDTVDLNLMETLKIYEYKLRATCGGMALCADCHCQVIDGGNNLPEPQDAELITLENHPGASFNSRLACQIRVAEEIDGLSIRLMGETE